MIVIQNRPWVWSLYISHFVDKLRSRDLSRHHLLESSRNTIEATFHIGNRIDLQSKLLEQNWQVVQQLDEECSIYWVGWYGNVGPKWYGLRRK